MSPLRVLIVGCGKIAGGFDSNRDLDAFPCTHAGAYRRDGRFEIHACVEPDELRRRTFMQTWRIPAGYESLHEVLTSSAEFDVVSICSSTSSHAQDLKTVLDLRPKLVFCEKPITTSTYQTEQIVEDYQTSNIRLVVNYTRRWDSDVIQIRNDVVDGRRGALRGVIGRYNKGLLNNGSHLLDLMHYIIGPLKVIHVGKCVEDFSHDDASVGAWLEGPNAVPVHIVAGHAADYAMFELELIFETGLVVMENGGMTWRERRVIDSDVFAGYRVLDRGVIRNGRYSQAMIKAVDNIYRSVTQDAQLASTGETALQAQRLCEEIKRKSIG